MLRLVSGSLKYHIILGGFSSWQLRDLTRFFNFWISKIAVNYVTYDFAIWKCFFRKGTVFAKSFSIPKSYTLDVLRNDVQTSSFQLFFSVLFQTFFFLVWIFFHECNKVVFFKWYFISGDREISGCNSFQRITQFLVGWCNSRP